MIVSPKDALRQAVAGLYGAFASYKLATRLVCCDHCTSDSDHSAIHAEPLKQLTAAHLSRYAFKAMTTWGSVDDFRHFLPRVFELLENGAFAETVDTEVVLGKLAYGKWRTWSAAEQLTVECFLQACWRSVLNTYPNSLEVDSLLCGIAQAVDNLSPYLSVWNVQSSRAAACHFADFVAKNSMVRKKTRSAWQLSNAWWSDRPAPAHQVKEWLLHDQRMLEIENAFHSFGTVGDPETMSILSDAFNSLGAIRLSNVV